MAAGLRTMPTEGEQVGLQETTEAGLALLAVIVLQDLRGADPARVGRQREPVIDSLQRGVRCPGCYLVAVHRLASS